MTLSTSVSRPGDYRRSYGGDTYGWDWSSTTHEGYSGAMDDLLEALGAQRVVMGKGLQGWSRSVEAYDLRGDRVGTVYYGGGREDLHVVSTSAQADSARRAVVAIGEARTARVDTRVDTKLSFERLRGICEDLGGRGTKLTYMESWTLKGKDRENEANGRTLYVGAPSSSVRVRVYEKWLESPGLYEEGTNRVEVQLRPPSRGKQEVSGWGPAETFCASRLTQRLAEALALEVASPGSLQKKKDTPDLERSLAAMGDQYGGVVEKWLSLSGGDVSKVLGHLGVTEDRTAAADLLG